VRKKKEEVYKRKEIKNNEIKNEIKNNE